jgi:hypothetical protein
MKWSWIWIGLVISGCAGNVDPGAKMAALTQPPIVRLTQLAHVAEFGATRASRLAAAEQGRTLASRCVASFPKEAGCYYYRAVTTGLYYQLHVIGYQRGLRAMVADCQRLNAIDAKYAGAGGYRILGQIYSQVPAVALGAESIVRDLERARAYLEQAVALAPAEFENRLALCEILVSAEAWNAAHAACALADARMSTQRRVPYYPTWRKALRRAKKRLAQAR